MEAKIRHAELEFEKEQYRGRVARLGRQLERLGGDQLATAQMSTQLEVELVVLATCHMLLLLLTECSLLPALCFLLSASCVLPPTPSLLRMRAQVKLAQALQEAARLRGENASLQEDVKAMIELKLKLAELSADE